MFSFFRFKNGLQKSVTSPSCLSLARSSNATCCLGPRTSCISSNKLEKKKKRLLRFLRYMFCWGFRPDSAHLSIPLVHSVTVYKHENRWLCTFRELSTCTATTLISSLNFTSFSNSEAAWREKGKCHVTFLWCTATWGLFNKRNVQGFKITLA